MQPRLGDWELLKLSRALTARTIRDVGSEKEKPFMTHSHTPKFHLQLCEKCLEETMNYKPATDYDRRVPFQLSGILPLSKRFMREDLTRRARNKRAVGRSFGTGP